MKDPDEILKEFQKYLADAGMNLELLGVEPGSIKFKLKASDEEMKLLRKFIREHGASLPSTGDLKLKGK